jgi:hypothetical protein
LINLGLDLGHYLDLGCDLGFYFISVFRFQDELRKLLASLTQANELAQKLKDRSAEMLTMIGHDMKQLKQ